GLVEVAALEHHVREHAVRRRQEHAPAAALDLQGRLGVLLRLREAAAAEDRPGAEAAGRREPDARAALGRVLDGGPERELGRLQILAEQQRGGGEVVREAVGGLDVEQGAAAERRAGQLTDLLPRLAAQ